MRLVLGVVTSIIFELVGAFILSQTDYSGYDFKTHKRARAIIAIGGYGAFPALYSSLRESGLTALVIVRRTSDRTGPHSGRRCDK